ncbi:hypothetical protein LCGC14_1168090 [marine sediment metagenome]|uniref:Uncharacterized protein n=1 Tax=marine sediment metagenome TaxID=412755 RepID=A0A0F9MDM0_9ZZZZ
MAERIRVSIGRKLWHDDQGKPHNTYISDVGIEKDLPSGVDKDSFQAGLATWCIEKIQENTEKAAAAFLNGQPTVDEIAKALGAEVTAFDRGAEATARDYSPAEEPPPTGGRAAEEAPATETRTPIDDNGDEYDIFKVDKFKIVVTDSGTKLAKVYGGRWQKFGVTVWEEVMEGVFPIGDLDVGHEFAPPQAMKAKAILNDKGNPKKVIEFQ